MPVLRHPRTAASPARTSAPSAGQLVATGAFVNLVVALQQTLVVPAVPQLPSLLGTTPGAVSWVVTATLISGAVATPVLQIGGAVTALGYLGFRLGLVPAAADIVWATVVGIGYAALPMLVVRHAPASEIGSASGLHIITLVGVAPGLAAVALGHRAHTTREDR